VAQEGTEDAFEAALSSTLNRLPELESSLNGHEGLSGTCRTREDRLR